MKLKEYLLRWLGLEHLENDMRNLKLKLNNYIFASYKAEINEVDRRIDEDFINRVILLHDSKLEKLFDPKFNKAILDLNEDRLLLHSEISNLKLQLEDIKLEIRAKTVDVNNTGATFEYNE